MNRFKKSLFILICAVAIAPKSYANNNLVKEFISLDKKANVEMGHVIIDGKTTMLSYGGILYFRENALAQPQNLGLAIFGETDTFPPLIMSSSDGSLPDFKEIQVNLPDEENGFICKDMSLDEQVSAFSNTK